MRNPINTSLSSSRTRPHIVAISECVRFSNWQTSHYPSLWEFSPLLLFVGAAASSYYFCMRTVLLVRSFVCEHCLYCMLFGFTRAIFSYILLLMCRMLSLLLPTKTKKNYIKFVNIGNQQMTTSNIFTPPSKSKSNRVIRIKDSRI